MSEGNEAQNEASNGTNMIELGIQAVVKDAVDAKFNDWMQSGFDPSAINTKLSEEQIEQAKEAIVQDVIDNLDYDVIRSNLEESENLDWLQTAIGRLLRNGYIDLDDYIDANTILYNMDEYDLYEKISDRIDYDDIAQHIDIESQVTDAMRNYSDGDGCEEVGRLAWRGLEYMADDPNNDRVLLSREDYDRIMEVVNMIKPLPPQPPTNREIVDELVATMDIAELQTMISLSVTVQKEKANAEAQAETQNAAESE